LLCQLSHSMPLWINKCLVVRLEVLYAPLVDVFCPLTEQISKTELFD
jgi:hypothetical protein